MNKETILGNIKKAKQFHLKQIEKIEYLVRGIPFNDEPTPVGRRECLFGQWLYGDEEQLRALLHNQHFDEIEQLHSHWHEEYYAIYQIFFEKRRGVLSKLSRGKPKVSQQERDRAEAYFADLKQITAQLLRKIEIIEKRVIALPESKFAVHP